MRTLIITLSLLLISGCSWFQSEETKAAKAKRDEPKTITEQDYYERVQRNLTSRSWALAIENLEALEAQFPFGTYGEQAQLELIYAHYESADYESATAAADRFIRLHPQHTNVDYAHYIKGLSLISESKGFLDSFLPRDDSKRDPGTARQAFATFTDLLHRYPNSVYAADARKHLVHLRNLLARHEIHVANYYFKREAYLAATNRGRYVVENFQRTPAVADGLAVMAQGYYLLNLKEHSANAAKTLATNFPDHPALNASGEFQYQDNFKDDSSWWKRLTLGYYIPENPPAYDSRPESLRDSSTEQEQELEQNEQQEPERGKSWLNWLSFGLLG